MKILYLCTGNSCRSQMAQGYTRHYLQQHDLPQHEVYSAGIEAHGINPRAVATMALINIDISQQSSDLIDRYSEDIFDVVVTVCDHALEVCPVLPGVKRTRHWSLFDPATADGDEEAIMTCFAQVRDEVRKRVNKLMSELL